MSWTVHASPLAWNNASALVEPVLRCNCACADCEAKQALLNKRDVEIKRLRSQIRLLKTKRKKHV